MTTEQEAERMRWSRSEFGTKELLNAYLMSFILTRNHAEGSLDYGAISAKRSCGD